MRVCMVAYAFFENDTRIQQYTSALVERGDTVDVIALRREGQSLRETVAGVNVERIQLRERNETGPLSYLSRILRFFIHSTIVLTRLHRVKKYQLIHVHSVPDFLVFTALIPKLAGVPVILDNHDILPELYASKFNLSKRSLLYKLLLLIERACAAWSDHVIIANHLWHERLISRSVSRAKSTAICNHPDPQVFFPRPKRRADGKFIMIYPGSLNWFQGLDLAIDALGKIADQVPQAELHIYGEGPAKDNLIRLTKSLHLDGRVYFKDWIPVDEVANRMGEADLAVVPKRAVSFANEAVSTKVAEFMALGVPVVESRTKVGTYYNDDSRVMFFEPGNADDLARCMLEMIRNDDLRTTLAQNAAAHMQNHNWGVKKKDYLDLVDSLVIGSGSRVDGRRASPIVTEVKA